MSSSGGQTRAIGRLGCISVTQRGSADWLLLLFGAVVGPFVGPGSGGLLGGPTPPELGKRAANFRRWPSGVRRRWPLAVGLAPALDRPPTRHFPLDRRPCFLSASESISVCINHFVGRLSTAAYHTKRRPPANRLRGISHAGGPIDCNSFFSPYFFSWSATSYGNP